jgi:hypothetical protein
MDPYLFNMNTEKIKGFIEDEINQTITIFEEEYPELSQEFKEIQDEMYRMFAAKMLDYGLGNISLGSNLEEEEDKKLSLTGIWLRCNDKINRLKNLLRRDGKVFVGNESMLDSFMDISNYGIIARLVMENKWKK